MEKPSKLTWLHLSDLHMNKAKHGWRGEEVFKKLGTDIRSFAFNQKLQVDLVFITGDLAYGEGVAGLSLDQQFTEFFKFLKPCLKSLGVPKERVFLVPGNHDVNRKKVLKSQTNHLASFLKLDYAEAVREIETMMREADNEWCAIQTRLEDYRSALDKRQHYRRLLQQEHHLHYAVSLDINGLKLGVGGFNGVWSCGGDNEKGNLWLGGLYQSGYMRPKLAQADIRIALMHHPLSWYVPAEEQSLREKMVFDFDFLLHGHEHQAWVEQKHKGHTVIAAGAGLGDKPEEFGYNLVSLDFKKGVCRTYLRRYSQRGAGGWVREEIPGATEDGVWQVPLPQRLLERFKQEEPKAAPPKHTPTDTADETIIPTPSTKPEDSAKPDTVVADPESQPLPDKPQGVSGIQLVGREQDIKALSRLLREPGMLVVAGLSGIGKTELIKATCRSSGREDRRFSPPIYESTDARALFHYLRPKLGLGEMDYPEQQIQKGDFKWLLQAKHRDLILHLENAQLLLGSRGFRDPQLGSLLGRISVYLPGIKVILETRELPDQRNFKGGKVSMYRVRGIDQQAVVDFYRRPFHWAPRVGWPLEPQQAGNIYQRLGGRDRTGGAHPFAMVLLANLAQDLGFSPVTVLEQYPEMLPEKLYKELFRDIFERVLSKGQVVLLGLLARYRDKIPDTHMVDLEKRAGEVDAIKRLESRALVQTIFEGEKWEMHALVREAVAKHYRPGDRVAAEEHELIGTLFLGPLKEARVSQRTVMAAADGVYHLLEGGAFLRLGEIAPGLVQDPALIPKLRTASRSLHAQKRHVEDRKVLELLCHLAPEDSAANAFLGNTIDRLDGKGSDLALKHFLMAYRARPDMPMGLANLGKAYLARHQAPLFLEMLEDESLHEDAVDDHVRAIQARALTIVGRAREASALRRRHIDADGRNAVFYAEEARYLADSKRLDEALALLERAAGNGAADEHTEAIRADLLQRSGQGGAGSALRRRHIDAGSRHAAFYNDEARYLADTNRLDEALTLLARAAGKGVADDHTEAIRADLLQRSGQGGEASALRRRHIDAGSRNAVFYADEARYLADTNRLEEALALLERAAGNGAANDHTEAIRADLLQRSGQGGEASALRRRHIDTGSRNAIFYNDEARYLADSKRLDEALALLERVDALGIGDEVTKILRGQLERRKNSAK